MNEETRRYELAWIERRRRVSGWRVFQVVVWFGAMPLLALGMRARQFGSDLAIPLLIGLVALGAFGLKALWDLGTFPCPRCGGYFGIGNSDPWVDSKKLAHCRFCGMTVGSKPKGEWHTDPDQLAGYRAAWRRRWIGAALVFLLGLALLVALPEFFTLQFLGPIFAASGFWPGGALLAYAWVMIVRIIFMMALRSVPGQQPSPALSAIHSRIPPR